MKQVENCYDSLTSRERDVIHGVIKGKLNKIIASELSVSTRTVEIHRANMMKKMDVKSIPMLIQCVSLLEKSGLLAKQN